jgi:hypothetical protein
VKERFAVDFKGSKDRVTSLGRKTPIEAGGQSESEYGFVPTTADYEMLTNKSNGCPLVQKELCGNAACPTLPPTPEPTKAPTVPTTAPTLRPNEQVFRPILMQPSSRNATHCCFVSQGDCSCGVNKPCMHEWERGTCYDMKPEWNVYLWRLTEMCPKGSIECFCHCAGFTPCQRRPDAPTTGTNFSAALHYSSWQQVDGRREDVGYAVCMPKQDMGSYVETCPDGSFHCQVSI